MRLSLFIIRAYYAYALTHAWNQNLYVTPSKQLMPCERYP